MVKVFSTSDCGACKATQKLLQERKVKYQVISLEEDTESIDFLLNKTGKYILPQTLFPDGDIIIGHSPNKLNQKIDSME